MGSSIVAQKCQQFIWQLLEKQKENEIQAPQVPKQNIEAEPPIYNPQTLQSKAQSSKLSLGQTGSSNLYPVLSDYQPEQQPAVQYKPRQFSFLQLEQPSPSQRNAAFYSQTYYNQHKNPQVQDIKRSESTPN